MTHKQIGLHKLMQSQEMLGIMQIGQGFTESYSHGITRNVPFLLSWALEWLGQGEMATCESRLRYISKVSGLYSRPPLLLSALLLVLVFPLHSFHQEYSK